MKICVYDDETAEIESVNTSTEAVKINCFEDKLRVFISPDEVEVWNAYTGEKIYPATGD
jgi:hypothetical protein